MLAGKLLRVRKKYKQSAFEAKFNIGGERPFIFLHRLESESDKTLFKALKKRLGEYIPISFETPQIKDYIMKPERPSYYSVSIGSNLTILPKSSKPSIGDISV